jgi:hypothetical protein
MRKIEQISIGAADRERLERLARDRNTSQKGGLEGADRAVGQRWLGGDGDFGSGWQERADGTPVAPSLCCQGRGRAAEGCNPSVAAQAAVSREDQTGGAHDAA